MEVTPQDNEILRLINGSRLYGLDTPQSDEDFIAIYVEPPEIVFSLRQEKTRLLHDRHPEAKNGPGDIDGQSYSVRHFFHLASKGNPTILSLVHAPDSAVVYIDDPAELIRDNADMFQSKQAGRQFLGYMNNQLQRLQGIKNGHKPNRPHLVEQYGYDTKYAMQIARLGYQGIEYMETGRVKSPLAPLPRKVCIDIRSGRLTYPEVVELLTTITSDLNLAINKSELPGKPDHDKINKISRDVHEHHWK